MRVITTYFSMECPRLVPGPSMEGAPSAAEPGLSNDTLHARREWLGMHEGEQRAALIGKPVPRRRPEHDKADVQVLFFTLLME